MHIVGESRSLREASGEASLPERSESDELFAARRDGTSRVFTERVRGAGSASGLLARRRRRRRRRRPRRAALLASFASTVTRSNSSLSSSSSRSRARVAPRDAVSISNARRSVSTDRRCSSSATLRRTAASDSIAATSARVAARGARGLLRAVRVGDGARELGLALRQARSAAPRSRRSRSSASRSEALSSAPTRRPKPEPTPPVARRRFFPPPRRRGRARGRRRRLLRPRPQRLRGLPLRASRAPSAFSSDFMRRFASTRRDSSTASRVAASRSASATAADSRDTASSFSPAATDLTTATCARARRRRAFLIPRRGASPVAPPSSLTKRFRLGRAPALAPGPTPRREHRPGGARRRRVVLGEILREQRDRSEERTSPGPNAVGSAEFGSAVPGSAAPRSAASARPVVEATGAPFGDPGSAPPGEALRAALPNETLRRTLRDRTKARRRWRRRRRT